MFLSQEEIYKLTGKKRRTQQKQILDAKGITYFENGIDELVILKAHVERVLSGEVGATGGTGPDFDKLRKAS
ncbi:DUF4224 domain-containing protein [Marinobacter salarius]|jgi:hypothetical protein|uniref:DUF4224 domain-containing protein n=1 Tax=Marinobacter salarius TaxID=1420917 RepID=UPI0010AA683B|nr:MULTISPECIES: DUF4224 domain-containing protein [Marinobacter]MBJ7302095.1 DUF4224 domain-containing protein [Marinobacter salarius]HIO30785.1 DUF4224 domain-containing protein [Marinobacter salarius]HIP01716.1 DUF4224 domain-containing protein [Marinobacter salarius]